MPQLSRWRPEATRHRKIHCPGRYIDNIDWENRLEVNYMAVDPGSVLSQQMHHLRTETWVVVPGEDDIVCFHDTQGRS